MQSQLRMQLVQALILLRHKGVITPDELLPLCFRMFQCHDKNLKSLLHNFIVSDIKNFNTGGRNDRLNRSIQNYLYKLIEVRCSQHKAFTARTSPLQAASRHAASTRTLPA
jgi:protein SDA1